MKLWAKNAEKIDSLIERFTIGQDRILDRELAYYDIIASKAHAKMLAAIGTLAPKELEEVNEALDHLLAEVERGTFKIEEQYEDIHSKIEDRLTQSIGEAGKKIHTARSRNDQVLVALHLFSKDQLASMAQHVYRLFKLLIGQSEHYKAYLLPGYTHFQVAMPSSFGMWFAAYAEMLVDDIYFVEASYKVADQNPLGSAAGYGSSFPIDRDFTTKEMGFSSLKINSVAAQMSRGKLERSAAVALSSIASTLSKLAYDITLYMSQNMDFISFPEHLTTGSSIMPHKKNPDVFELIRSRCNKIQALPHELTFITNNLPSGYHRDFQLLKESYFPAFSSLKECLVLTEHMLRQIEVKDKLLDRAIYNYLFSVEEVNLLVRQGVPFRDAYKQVGRQIETNTFSPDRNLSHSHVGSIGNLSNNRITDKMERAMQFFPKGSR